MNKIRFFCHELSCLLNPDTNEAIYPGDLNISSYLKDALEVFYSNRGNNKNSSFLSKVIYETDGLFLAVELNHELSNKYEVEFYSYLYDTVLTLPKSL